MSAASVSPPPFPKMSLSVWHVGHTKWLMFSISPSGGTFSFSIHPDGAAGVGQRHGLRRRDEHRAGDGHALAQAERHVARARRQIDDQVVDVFHATSRKNCWMTPCSIGPRQMTGGVVLREERHRHELDPVLLRRDDPLAVGRQLGLDAEHDRHVRAVDVAVDHRDARARLAQGDRQVHRHGRLAHAPFARADRDDVPHAGNRLLVEVRTRRTGPDLGRHL